MSFMDKVKKAAGDVAGAAKKGAGSVQTKAHVHGLRGKADEAAQKLGYLLVRERTEGTAMGAEADELVAQIADLEKQIAEAEAGSAEPAEGEAGGAPAEGETEGGSGEEGSGEPAAT
jgi:hypothetical protein